MPFYQSILHGYGFHIEDDSDTPIVGFYTGRKVYAADERQAEKRLHERLLGEEKVDCLVTQSREAGCDPKIESHQIFPISMWRYLFGSYPRGFIFYPHSETDDERESQEGN